MEYKPIINSENPLEILVSNLVELIIIDFGYYSY